MDTNRAWEHFGDRPSVYEEDVCEPLKLLQDVEFDSFWKKLVARNSSGGSEDNVSKVKKEELESQLSKTVQHYLTSHVMLTELIALSDDWQSSQSLQPLCSAVDLSIETALAIQSLELPGVTGGNGSSHDSGLRGSRSRKKRIGIEQDRDLLPSTSSWGGCKHRILGLSKKVVLDSISIEKSKLEDHNGSRTALGHDLASHISARLEKRVQAMHDWCCEDGMEGSNLTTLEERSSQCLQHIQSKHDSVISAERKLEWAQRELNMNSMECQRVRMKIFETLKYIVDFATDDCVQHDKVKVKHYQDVMELQSKRCKALRLALEAGLYTSDVNRALKAIQQELHRATEDTDEKLLEVEKDLSKRAALGKRYLDISDDYCKLQAMISEASHSLKNFHEIEKELDQAVDP